MPVQLRSLIGKIDPVAELLIRDLVQHANNLEQQLKALTPTPQVVLQQQPVLLSRASSGTSGDAITQLTGDGTATGPGSVPLTLSATGVTPGTYGDATTVGQFTVDAAGRLTAAVDVPITFPADYVVMSDGATPTPAPVDDGFGNFIYIPYTP